MHASPRTSWCASNQFRSHFTRSHKNHGHSQREFPITRQFRACAAQHGASEASVSRRATLECGAGLAWAAVALSMCSASKAVAEEEQQQQRSRGISRYIKRRKLEPLETYVPAVLAARSQLEQAGNKMREDLPEARNLLRNGPFDGLRDNIRALGQYAEKQDPKEGSKLSDQFLSAVERYDFVLFQAKRDGQVVGPDADKALRKATIAIDRLLGTVPADILKASQEIVDKIEGSNVAPLESTPDAKQVDQLLQLVPT